MAEAKKANKSKGLTARLRERLGQIRESLSEAFHMPTSRLARQPAPVYIPAPLHRRRR